jgi:hypothetical protein
MNFFIYIFRCRQLLQQQVQQSLMLGYQLIQQYSVGKSREMK